MDAQVVPFLPLTWTIVHPIDESSPLYGKTAEDLARMKAEFLILIKAFDDTFKDKEFLATVDKLKLEFDPRSGEEVQALVTKLYALPANVIERTKRAMVYKGPK